MLKNFRLHIVLRVCVLTATIYFLTYLLHYTDLYATIFIIGVLAIFQVYALVRFVETMNKNLTRFLTAIKYSDFSQSFAITGFGAKFDELNHIFSEVIKKFHEARAEKEEHFNYLQTVVQHIGIGLIVFHKNGELQLINNAAKKIFRYPHLRNIKFLKRLSPLLVETLLQLKSGDKALVKVEDREDLLHLAMYATEFKMRDKLYTLVSIQNIQSELEEQEMEAWQKLIRVLTHEIMNSITPIASLAETVNGMLPENADADDCTATIDDLADIRSAMQTIQKRSEGLLTFVQSYRSLTRLPRPDFQIFKVSDLLNRVVKLMENLLEENKIELNLEIHPESLELTGDASMIEQVCINLLKNSIQALRGIPTPRVGIQARLDDRGRIVVLVSDNGVGITAEALEKIFIPFFTTKPEGSGIGLSLSRQIMRLHRGNISVRSVPLEKTIFALRF